MSRPVWRLLATPGRMRGRQLRLDASCCRCRVEGWDKAMGGESEGMGDEPLRIAIRYGRGFDWDYKLARRGALLRSPPVRVQYRQNIRYERVGDAPKTALKRHGLPSASSFSQLISIRVHRTIDPPAYLLVKVSQEPRRTRATLALIDHQGRQFARFMPLSLVSQSECYDRDMLALIVWLPASAVWPRQPTYLEKADRCFSILQVLYNCAFRIHPMARQRQRQRKAFLALPFSISLPASVNYAQSPDRRRLLRPSRPRFLSRSLANTEVSLPARPMNQLQNAARGRNVRRVGNDIVDSNFEQSLNPQALWCSSWTRKQAAHDRTKDGTGAVRSFLFGQCTFEREGGAEQRAAQITLC